MKNVYIMLRKFI